MGGKPTRRKASPESEATKGTNGHPFPDLRDKHQQPSSEFETTKATVSKHSFLLIYCCIVLGDKLTHVNLCNCLLFLENRVKGPNLEGLRLVFIIYRDVKDRMRVRLGCEERLDLCERSRAEIFIFSVG
jgi:hypothetical protein